MNIDDLQEGKLIDVMDYMSKWSAAIITKVEDTKFQVVVEGGLEMEIIKEESKEVIAPFQTKSEKCSQDKIQKLKNRVKEGKEEEKQEGINVITHKKHAKGKRHQNNANNTSSTNHGHKNPTPPIEEPEKVDVSRVEMNLYRNH